jgi:acyl-CoA thioesterase
MHKEIPTQYALSEGGAHYALDRSLALTSRLPQGFSAVGSPDYWNAFGPFGGWIATVMLKAVLAHPDAKGEPLNLQAQFIGAIAPAPFDLNVRCLKQNRSTAFWQVELLQAPGVEAGDARTEGASDSNTAAVPGVCATATIVLTQWRETQVATDARMPSVVSPEGTTLAPPQRARKPAFLDRFDYRFVQGVFGQGAQPSMDSRLWLRDAQSRPLDALLLTCLADAPLPSIWLRQDVPVMITTVTYNVSFRVPQVVLAACGSSHVLLDTRAASAQRGFYDQHTDIWSSDGTLIAQTDQIAWFSDKPLVRK